MNADVLLAYFHFASILAMASVLAAELATLTQPGSASRLHRLKRLDGFYGLLAGLTLASGIARVVWGAKGSAFYLGNPVFHIKVTLFLVVGLLSIYPTLKFLRWSKVAQATATALPDDAETVRVRRLVIIQLGILAVIPLAATLMARGIGLR